jgi:hypothetical protein
MALLPGFVTLLWNLVEVVEKLDESPPELQG